MSLSSGLSAHRRARVGAAGIAALALALSFVLLDVAKPRPSLAAGLGAPEAAACESLEQLQLTEVASISAELVTSGFAAGQTGLPEFCRVKIVVEPAINIEVWLPTDTYNGRFQAIGGGGYAGVLRYTGMADALRAGYATAETDTGHVGNDGSFALGADGELNWQLIEDFASRSLFQLTEKAQTLIPEFYGASPEYSYWNGCSTGGRQGLMLAQQYPDGYDGILAGAPAINWDRFIPTMLWPQVVMQEELGGPIAPCKLGAATAAAIAHCDPLDGVVDGVLDDPRRCDYSAASLVGQVTDCGVFTAADARAIDAIWDGARTEDGSFLWYGRTPGSPLTSLAGPAPHPYPVMHAQYWVEQDPSYDWRTLDYAGFEDAFRDSQKLFNDVIGTDNPDLSAYEQSGGKLLLWHGWNDQLISPEGTIDYFERVLDTMKNKNKVEDFARLFMAPGVNHCRGGDGATEFDMFAELVNWVENGDAPEQITATRTVNGTTSFTRTLCQYPYVARYDGKGDPNQASSFDCKPNFGRWKNAAR